MAPRKRFLHLHSTFLQIQVTSENCSFFFFYYNTTSFRTFLAQQLILPVFLSASNVTVHVVRSFKLKTKNSFEITVSHLWKYTGKSSLLADCFCNLNISTTKCIWFPFNSLIWAVSYTCQDARHGIKCRNGQRNIET